MAQVLQKATDDHRGVGLARVHSASHQHHWFAGALLVSADHHYGDVDSGEGLSQHAHFCLSGEKLQFVEEIGVGVGDGVGESDLLVVLEVDIEAEFEEVADAHALVEELISKLLLAEAQVGEGVVSPLLGACGEEERIEALTSVGERVLVSSACRPWSGCRG